MKDKIRDLKRQLILDSACKVFYERGFAGSTMDAVAENMNATKPFLYSYFTSKHALLEALYDRGTAKVVETLIDSLDSDDPPEVQLRRFIERFARLNMEDWMLAAVYLQEEKHLTNDHVARLREQQKVFDKKFEALLARGAASGAFQFANPAITALALTGMVRWIQRWYKPSGDASVDDIAMIMADIAIKSVTAPGGAPPPQTPVSPSPAIRDVKVKVRKRPAKARAGNTVRSITGG